METNILNIGKKDSHFVLHFSRSAVQIYSPKIKQLISEKLPQNTIKDLEIVDKNALALFLQSLFTKYKLSAKNVIIILAPNIYYEKILKSVGEEQESEMRSFLDTVPFDALRSKVYIQGTTSRVIAINKNLCESLVWSLEQAGIGVTAVIPTGLVPSLAGKATPDKEANDYVLKNIPTLKMHTITQTLEISDPEDVHIAPPKNTRIYFLGGIFALLLLALGVLVVVM